MPGHVTQTEAATESVCSGKPSCNANTAGQILTAYFHLIRFVSCAFFYRYFVKCLMIEGFGDRGGY